MPSKIRTYLVKSVDNSGGAYNITLSRLIGILGILLPLICIAGGWWFAKTPVQQSISLYYYTNMRDFLVGLLFVVSLFLITYRGEQNIESIISTITGITGLGIAIFPCICKVCSAQCNCELCDIPTVGIFNLVPKTSNIFHLTSAALFFLLLAINSIFIFTKGTESSNKKKRDKLHVICGIAILIFLIVMAIIMILFRNNPEMLCKTKLIIIFESLALLAFGISWLTRGNMLFAD